MKTTAKCIILFACFTVAMEARSGPAWDAMQRGLKSYAEKDFAAAATNFDAAAMSAEKEKFDPAVAAFDRANALFNSGKAKDAAHVYEEALRTPDLGLQGRAYHNRGNSMLGIANELEGEQKFEEAIKSVDEALAMYERSMTLLPKDADPKINYELAGLKRKELEEKLKQQQQQQQQQNKDNKDQNKDQNQDQKNNSDQQDKEQQNQKSKDQNKDQQDQNKQDQQQKQDQQAGDDKDSEQQQARTEQMSPQEAAMLLDAMKQREQSDREKIGAIWLKRANAGKMQPVDKDW